MPTLNWIGKEAVVRHHKEVPFRLLEPAAELSCGAADSCNQPEGVEWWVRNVERKPTSFWLQTASDRFYPDFLIKMRDGMLVAVEYKGAHIADSRDSREKKRIGELWARRSDGRCRFAWVENRNWQALKDAVR